MPSRKAGCFAHRSSLVERLIRLHCNKRETDDWDAKVKIGRSGPHVGPAPFDGSASVPSHGTHRFRVPKGVVSFLAVHHRPLWRDPGNRLLILINNTLKISIDIALHPFY